MADLGTLSVGDKVKFGSIYSQPIVWVVAAKNHTGYPSNSVTLVSEEVIKIMAFDASEPSSPSSQRKYSGNNRYFWSNIRQWLNNSNVAWYTAQHDTDAPPNVTGVYNNPYETEAGFLNAFSLAEQGALLNTNITVKKTDYDGAFTEVVGDKVFLLSVTEIGLEDEWYTPEGSLLPLFGTASYRGATVTEAALSNSETSGGGIWWLRTPFFSTANQVRQAYSSSTTTQDYANRGNYGLRPACNLSQSTPITNTPDAEGNYAVSFWTPPAISPMISGVRRTYSDGATRIDGVYRNIDEVHTKINGVWRKS